MSDKTYTLNAKHIISASLLYLLIPNILFLLGWLVAVVAIPFCIALLGAAIWVVKQLPSVNVRFTKNEIIRLFIVLAASLIVVEMIGFHGHSLQHGDFFVRNPIYETLIRDEWPIYNPDGQYFVYYLSFWLPPAFLAKITEGAITPATILWLWVYIGVALGFLTLFLRIRGRILPLFILLFLVGTVWDWRFIQNSIHYRAQFSPFCAMLDSWLEYLNLLPVHVPWRTALNCTFNHSIPVFLTFTLLISPYVPRLVYPFFAALMVSGSPLGALAIFGILIYRLIPAFTDREQCFYLASRWYLWVATLLVVLVALYFAEGSSAVTPRWAWEKHPVVGLDKALACTGQLAGAAIMIAAAFIFLYKYRRTGLFIYMILMFALCSVFFMGAVNNEWQFKASLLPYCCFAFLASYAWKHMGHKSRILFMCFVLFCSGAVVQTGINLFRTYSWNKIQIQKNIRNEWNGHLYHPEHWVSSSFWGDGNVNPIFIRNQALPKPQNFRSIE